MCINDNNAVINNNYGGLQCVFYAGYQRLKTHTLNMYYLSPLHCSNGYTNASNVTLYVGFLYCSVLQLRVLKFVLLDIAANIFVTNVCLFHIRRCLLYAVDPLWLE